jgi:hypothetical protein
MQRGLDSLRLCSYFVLFTIVELRVTGVETLGDAYSAGWSVRVRCSREDPRGSRASRCDFEGALDMATLVCTRGRGFPLARLASRLRCPRCGDMHIKILFDVPGEAIPVWIAQHQRRA